jgi:trehalose synthase
MLVVHEVPVAPRAIEPLLALVTADQAREATRQADLARARLAGRVFWNVNSTARGGGVAEMLYPLIGYARGVGIDARWLIINGSPAFFRITKRLHHALHGSAGDGSPLGDDQRAIYEQVSSENADDLLGLVGPRDVVLLHDPQTAGLAPRLMAAGAVVVWRCHIGTEMANEQTALGWSFLRPYLANLPALVFSRAAYVPAWCDRARTAIIQPSIDAFTPKNQELDDATIRAILVQTGLVQGPIGPGQPLFRREDGGLSRVERQAHVTRLGPAPSWDTPLVVQVSRWDPLKDPVGVMQGFADLVDGGLPADAQLVLAGPSENSVADDPEGSATYDGVVAAWRRLLERARRRVQLAALPMADLAENAAIVNALQRHAAVVVQKSLHEGFGLTVTEAMWKARPIVASAVGGIQDQIADGVQGLLIPDPLDLAAFGSAVRRLLEDRPLAEQLGRNAHQRVVEHYLAVRHLVEYARLLERLDG